MKIIKSVEVPVIIEGGTKNLIDLENAIKQGINSNPALVGISGKTFIKSSGSQPSV